jgi:hypothetical protein
MARATVTTRASTKSSRKRIASSHWQRPPAGLDHAVHTSLPDALQRPAALPGFGQASVARAVEPGIQRKAHEASEGPDQKAGRKRRPKETPDAEAAEIGKQALDSVGYEKLIERAIEVGLVKKGTPDPSAAKRPIQRMPIQGTIDTGVIQRQAAALSAGAIFSSYAVAAGITSQLDTPIPGPADLVALGILVVGLVHAGVVAMSSSRPRTVRCRCRVRSFRNLNPPADCPPRVESFGVDIGRCQANAKNTAPQHCRAFYGHCQVLPDRS